MSTSTVHLKQPIKRGGHQSKIRSASVHRATISSNCTTEAMFEFQKPYVPPSWIGDNIGPIPDSRVKLGLFPTPIHKWNVPRLPENIQLFVKRDDLSGMQLSGNKVRKLEFLLAEAKSKGHDCVITIGGIQSNHCRATAVASRYLGLDCHLILRNSRFAAEEDPGLTGNLLVERLVGAHIRQVTKNEYTSVGSMNLLSKLAEELRAQGKNPYLIPVGGSNALGTWGYLEFMNELKGQGGDSFTDIVMASGSGGTLSGIALGNHLAGLGMKVHGYGVCDDPSYFYEYCQEILDDMGASQESIGLTSDGLFSALQAKGQGYAMSTKEELTFVKEVAETTGIILDPVYSGKALYGFVEDVLKNPSEWAGKKVLFLHTGGLLGMYEKVDQLQELMDPQKSLRMSV